MAAQSMNNILQIIFLFLIIYMVWVLFFQDKSPFESVSNDTEQQEFVAPQKETAPSQIMVAEEEQTQPMNEFVQPKEQITSEELLPKYDEANEFAKQNPVSDLLKEQNFLISGYHMGINTVMQSNKISYHDLRSAPPIPKQNVGPFLQSSYETPAGTNRRSLEIL